MWLKNERSGHDDITDKCQTTNKYIPCRVSTDEDDEKVGSSVLRRDGVVSELFKRTGYNIGQVRRAIRGKVMITVVNEGGNVLWEGERS